MKKPVRVTPPSPAPICGTCLYGIPEAENLWCHRYPPTAFMKDGLPSSVYAPVGKDKPGCGEHRRGK